MSDDEIVVIVDEQNQVVGARPRKEMRERRLIHRATYIFVFNSAGQLYVQKRTPTKDMYPSYLDLAAGGVVQHEESYELSAIREAEEELGITGTPLKPHGDFFYEDSENRIWGRIFTCVFDREFRHQPEEVADGWFCDVAAALAGELSPVTPDSLRALSILRERGAI